MEPISPNINILIVDDDENTRNTIAAIISMAGLKYKIFMAQSGLEAYDIINKHNIELVLLDLKLPDIKGPDVLKFIKNQNNVNKYIAFIIITAFDTSNAISDCLKNGAFWYMSKDSAFDKLPYLMKRALRFRRLEMSVI